MGYRTDANGVASGDMVTIDTNVQEIDRAPTTKSSLQVNLPSDAAAGATFTTSVPVYDSLGASNTVEVTWTKSATATDTWTATFANPTATDNPSGGPTGGGFAPPP